MGGVVKSDRAATVTLRQATADDAPACGRIIYEAFRSIAERHGFEPDFPAAETAVQMAGMQTAHPAIFGIVAELEGRIVGSNFLDERDPIRGVGPITVDPRLQQQGVGRKLMEAVLERGRGAAGIRLLQDAHNMTSLSLYASLGFEVREPVVLMRGRPGDRPPAGIEIRRMQVQDFEACGALCKRVHGFERVNELRDAVKWLAPFVAACQGRITAYASSVTFWVANHGVAETEDDMRALLLGAAALQPEPLWLLVPTRQASFFRWCLGQGLRSGKSMTLMTMGAYQPPQGCYFPSVVY
jgi:predicted N-acetyltransferase YhbS